MLLQGGGPGCLSRLVSLLSRLVSFLSEAGARKDTRKHPKRGSSSNSEPSRYESCKMAGLAWWPTRLFYELFPLWPLREWDPGGVCRWILCLWRQAETWKTFNSCVLVLTVRYATVFDKLQIEIILVVLLKIKVLISWLGFVHAWLSLDPEGRQATGSFSNTDRVFWIFRCIHTWRKAKLRRKACLGSGLHLCFGKRLVTTNDSWVWMEENVWRINMLL